MGGIVQIPEAPIILHEFSLFEWTTSPLGHNSLPWLNNTMHQRSQMTTASSAFHEKFWYFILIWDANKFQNIRIFQGTHIPVSTSVSTLQHTYGRAWSTNVVQRSAWWAKMHQNLKWFRRSSQKCIIECRKHPCEERAYSMCFIYIDTVRYYVQITYVHRLIYEHRPFSYYSL